MTDTKPSNPKDLIGSTKISTTIVPDAIEVYACLAFMEGASKYGASNWSNAGVRCSIYLDAIDRHLKKFKAGEWADVVTCVPHLSSALAGIGIILDAHHRGMITDDRPPPNPELIALIDGFSENVKNIQELFADFDPKHFTILDGEENNGRLVGAPLIEIKDND